MKPWIIIQKICFFILALFVLVGIGFIFDEPTKRLFELQKQKEKLKKQNSELVTKTEELKEDQQKFHTSKTFVERIAKKDFKLIRADECVFKFEN
ncbi:MAG: septum formation initiator family protein [Kiritimatiellae bacterium]|jgi:cell division protein FtsB|nr:septum formation initiator family protein [Kiritimatiellia bacterium]